VHAEAATCAVTRPPWGVCVFERLCVCGCVCVRGRLKPPCGRKRSPHSTTRPRYTTGTRPPIAPTPPLTHPLHLVILCTADTHHVLLRVKGDSFSSTPGPARATDAMYVTDHGL
jgi:hypothetical protein